MRVDDINVQAWMSMLGRINDEAPGFEGARATLTLTQMVVTTTDDVLGKLSPDVFILRGLQPVRIELDGLRSRIESYETALDDVEGPITAKQVDTSEQVRQALITGQQPTPYPPLAMGDARLAATLYNQTIQAAAVDAEQDAVLFAAVGGTTGTRDKLREWLTGAVTQLEEHAPGELPTLRDKVVTTLEDAATDVARLLQTAGDILPRLLKWLGIGAGAALLAYLLWRLNRK
jgi:hypothetical protein